MRDVLARLNKYYLPKIVSRHGTCIIEARCCMLQYLQDRFRKHPSHAMGFQEAKDPTKTGSHIEFIGIQIYH